MLTLEQLKLCSGRMSKNPGLAASYIDDINRALEEGEINSPERIAAFLAQIFHESAEFRFMSEEWGPSEVQKHYDPPFHLAVKLGNTAAGDGFKYRGAGPLQLTGKDNFRLYGQTLGLDLVKNPDQARQFGVGMRIAALYWSRHHLNALADSGDFQGITRAINGGLNGLAQRETYWATCKKVLGA